MNKLINLLFALKMYRLGKGAWRNLMKKTKQPREQQLQLLNNILRRNQEQILSKAR